MSSISDFVFDPADDTVSDAELKASYKALKDARDDAAFRKLSTERRFNSAIDRKASATARLESATAQKNAFQAIVASLPANSPLLPSMQYELERATWAETQALRAIDSVSNAALAQLKQDYVAFEQNESDYGNFIAGIASEWTSDRGLNIEDLTS